MEFAEFIKTPTVENICMKRPFMSPITGTLCITGMHKPYDTSNIPNEQNA
jgi:hypothetical protein